jgi:hypothetical protein
MDKKYLSKLPDDLTEMVQKIELFIGDEIQIKIDDSRKDILACEVNKTDITILIPKEDYFPEAAVLHEILHIHRFSIQKVPQIKVCDNSDIWTPELETGLTKLDNMLEHLVILQEEFSLRPERINYWKSRTHKALDNFDFVNHIKDDQERIVLEYWVFIQQIFSDNTLVNKAKSLIDILDINDRAEKFFHEIKSCINTKEKLVNTCFSHLRLPIEIGCLEYMDIKNKESYERPLTILED